jgi:hypothetical protein
MRRVWVGRSTDQSTVWVCGVAPITHARFVARARRWTPMERRGGRAHGSLAAPAAEAAASWPSARGRHAGLERMAGTVSAIVGMSVAPLAPLPFIASLATVMTRMGVRDVGRMDGAVGRGRARTRHLREPRRATPSWASSARRRAWRSSSASSRCSSCGLQAGRSATVPLPSDRCIGRGLRNADGAAASVAGDTAGPAARGDGDRCSLAPLPRMPPLRPRQHRSAAGRQ